MSGYRINMAIRQTKAPLQRYFKLWCKPSSTTRVQYPGIQSYNLTFGFTYTFITLDLVHLRTIHCWILSYIIECTR